jgi:hypothetical protein
MPDAALGHRQDMLMLHQVLLLAVASRHQRQTRERKSWKQKQQYQRAGAVMPQSF